MLSHFFLASLFTARWSIHTPNVGYQKEQTPSHPSTRLCVGIGSSLGGQTLVASAGGHQ